MHENVVNDVPLNAEARSGMCAAQLFPMMDRTVEGTMSTSVKRRVFAEASRMTPLVPQMPTPNATRGGTSFSF